MKVMHLSTAFSWRGGEQQIAYLLEELALLQVDQKVLCPKGSSLAQYCQTHHIPFAIFRKGFSFNPLAAQFIARQCQQWGAEILHLHDAHAHTLACLSTVFSQNKTPFVLSRKVDFPIKKNRFSQWKYNHPAIKKIICVSDAIRQILKPDIAQPEKLTVVHDGIDLDRFKYPASNILRQAYNIPAHTPIIANIAAIAPHKDYFTFVKTAKLLLEQGINARFLIIGGDGGEQTKIEQFIDEKQLNQYIVLTGFRSDIPKIFPEINVFLFTSKTEGLGSSILDAFAANVPVVATQAGGVPELITHDYNGLLAPIQDVEALAKQTRRVLEEEALAKQLRQNAQQEVKAFSKRELAKKTFAIYKEL